MTGSRHGGRIDCDCGNQTGRGGLFAVDSATGKLRWSYRPAFSSGTASVSTAPALAGTLVRAPFAAAHPGAVIAVSLATGKEVWRGPDPEVNAGVAVDGGLAYVQAKGGLFYALDAATGREQWKVEFGSNLAPCVSQPLVRDGVIDLPAMGKAGMQLRLQSITCSRWTPRPARNAGIIARKHLTSDQEFA